MTVDVVHCFSHVHSARCYGSLLACTCSKRCGPVIRRGCEGEMWDILLCACVERGTEWYFANDTLVINLHCVILSVDFFVRHMHRYDPEKKLERVE